MSLPVALLCGGLGTRLYPRTAHTQGCFAPQPLRDFYEIGSFGGIEDLTAFLALKERR